MTMRYYFILLALLWSTASFSQSPCFCQVELVPQSDCCVNIIASWSASCNSTQAQANHIFINTAFAPPFTAGVKSFDLYYPQLSGTLSAGNTQLDINSTVNIATFQPLGQDILLGSLCYENVNSTVVTNEINMDNNGISSCMGVSEVPISCVPSQPWNKIYGDANDNAPTKVKAFGDGVYVVGTIDLSGVKYGTLSKFDITDGSLLWHFQHDVPSVFNDVEYSPLVQEVIVVGATEPNPPTGAPFDNKSLIMRRRASDGTMPIGGLKEYDHPGREFFEVIKRHPYPEDTNFPFYVLGRENPASNFPSGADQVVVYNFNRNLASGWDKRYVENGGIEIEGYRGIVPLRDGDLLLLGNGSIANEGAVIKVDGRKGDWMNSWYHPDGIDWYDGVHLPNGMVVLSGTRFSSDEAIVMAVNPNNMTPLAGLLFPNQSNFREIGWHSPSSGAGATDLYLFSREKNNTLNRNILNKVSLSIFPATGAFMNVDYSRYLEDQELSFNNPRLQVVPARDAIFYADNRTYNPVVYGGEDMLVGVYDLNLNSDCVQSLNSPVQNYIISPTTFGMTSTDININQADQGTQPSPLGYECTNFCSNCTADFTWTSDCCELQLLGSATGTGPYTFEWDFLCDGSVEATGQSATLSNLPVGPNILCLKITDATGCMATVQQTVTVVGDNTPPVINCPGNITLPTDPGECFATYSIPMLTATDDCDDDLMVSCSLSGATTAPIGPENELPKGVTTVTCATEDDKGNFANCTYNITVEDQEPPVISCPGAITSSVAACAGGISVQFPDPTVTDNCPMVTWTYSHQSGDFFPCGTTTVTGTATDMAGNQSTCTFPIIVDCQCAEVGGQTISCTDVDDQFAFSVSVNDLTGSGTNGCTVSVSSPQSGITISGVTTTGSGPGYTISGLIDVAAPPMPNTITIVVSVSCVCPDGTVHDCDFPITLQPPCCKDISVDPQEVCENGPAVQIPLVGCGNLYDVQQVRWYVADAPCPPASWGPPLQVTNGCAPLTLSPQFHNGDICVYAEVDMGPDAGPCTMLTSNIATINLCPPISCDLSGGQAYCYTGSPITPSMLTLMPPMTDCSYTIEWFDPNGNLIPSATGMTDYQPPALDFTLPNTECSQSYTYTAKVTSVCGEQSCSATFRLDNDDAPVGTINLLPPDVNPLCYGEDAVLEYIPECAGDPERWDWFIRPDAVPAYTPLPSNGDRNPLYYTNRLYEDTWVKVEKTNGVCPADEIEFFLDIIDPLTINSFTADYSPICAPASVDLEVDFDPLPAPAGCTYTIHWYKGINRIHTSIHTSATAMYTYTPPAGIGLTGNYYCIIESSCCPQREKSDVVVLDPPMEVYAIGPCYRCNCETVTLNGIVLYPIPGFNCTYQWYDNGVAIPGETGTSLTVDPSWDGPFTFEVTCTGGATTCTLSDTYILRQCGNCPPVNTYEVVRLNAKVYPTPTHSRIYLELDKPVNFETIEFFDAQGKKVRSIAHPSFDRLLELDLSGLPVGAYTIRAISTEQEMLLEKVIKQ